MADDSNLCKNEGVCHQRQHNQNIDINCHTFAVDFNNKPNTRSLQDAFLQFRKQKQVIVQPFLFSCQSSRDMREEHCFYFHYNIDVIQGYFWRILQ